MDADTILTVPARIEAVDLSEWQTGPWYVTELSAASVMSIKDQTNNVQILVEFCAAGLCDPIGNLLIVTPEQVARLAKLPLKLLSRVAEAVRDLNGLGDDGEGDEEKNA